MALSLVILQSSIGLVQDPLGAYEKILRENSDVTVHPNHYLLGGVREKLMSSYMKRRQKLVQMLQDKDKVESLAASGKVLDVHRYGHWSLTLHKFPFLFSKSMVSLDPSKRHLTV